MSEVATKVRPMGDRILIRTVSREETTKSGLVLPDTAKEKPMEGEVLAVGRGRTTDDGTVIEVDVKVGDLVLFAKYSGTEVRIDDSDLLIIAERDLLAVLS
ncbi:MAG: co-chaperone GroES [Chloroflexota bacterium]|nr:co-chaperone GroES [Chloroflexota bacterium]